MMNTKIHENQPVIEWLEKNTASVSFFQHFHFGHGSGNQGNRGAENASLLRSLGCHRTLYLCRTAGGSIMNGWMKEENTMITCCSDGTRPVIFKIERIDAD